MDAQRIGFFIKSKRMEKGWTQQNLAEKLCVSNKAVSKWECGRGTPDYDCLIDLSHLFEVPVDDILNYPEGKIGIKRSCNDSFFRYGCFIIWLLVLACIMLLLDFAGIIKVNRIPLYIDIPTVITMIGLCNVICILRHEERDYFNVIAGLFSRQNRANFPNAYHIIIKRLISVVISAFICTLSHLAFLLINQYRDMTYLTLPLIYAGVIISFYLMVIATYVEPVSYRKRAVQIALGFLAILFVFLLVARFIPRKEILFQDEQMIIEIQEEGNAYKTICYIREGTFVSEAEISKDKLSTAREVTFQGHTFKNEKEGISYIEYPSVEAFMDDTSITLLSQAESSGKCFLVSESSSYFNQVICSEAHYNDTVITETIYLSKDDKECEGNIVLGSPILFPSKPEVSHVTNKGIEYYFISGGNENAVFIFDGTVWYELRTRNSQEKLWEYVMLFERG